MVAPRPSTSLTGDVEVAHSLALLSEYTHTLDSLPLDLSRNFADLRELDAVLSSSVHSITNKVQKLIEMIEERTSSKQERLFLLEDIAEEARRLKLGGEDKIRVACQAADNLKGHTTHMKDLLLHVPYFDPSLLKRNTTYPHVSARLFIPVGALDNGRRRRGGFGSLLASAADASPNKRKRMTREDDIDPTSNKSPRKDKVHDAAPIKSRNIGRVRRQDRAGSPTESVLSVTSHVPLKHFHQENGASIRAGAANGTSRGATTSTGVKKRSRPSAQNDEMHAASGTRRDTFNAPPSSSTSHPSLPNPFAAGGSNLHQYDVAQSHSISTAEWPGPHAHTQLEGPGMPVARNAAHTSMSLGPAGLLIPNPPILAAPAAEVQAVSVATAETATEGGDGDGDGDDRNYCFCDGPSYGEMIACDDRSCEREWFHLACIGLTVPPEGTWYCDACKTRRNAKRGGRGGKRRPNGAR